MLSPRPRLCWRRRHESARGGSGPALSHHGPRGHERGTDSAQHGPRHQCLGRGGGRSGPNDDNPYAFIWLPEGNYGLSAGPLHSLTELDEGLAECISEAHDINDRGEIAGQIGSGDVETVAWFWWYSDETWLSVNLDSLGHDSRAFAVSNHADPIVVGWHETMEYTCSITRKPLKVAYQAVVESGSVTLTNLTYPPPVNMDIFARDLDDLQPSPQIVGMMDICGGAGFCESDNRTARWWFGVLAGSLDGLHEDPGNDRRAEARGISTVGDTTEIAGIAWDWTNCIPQAAYWLTTSGACQLLPGPASTAVAIKRHDDVVRVVGWDGRPDDPSHECDALLWQKEDGQGWQMIVLDTAIPLCSHEDWNLYQAHDVNADGWIVGVGRSLVPQQVHAFLLTPVRSYDECPWDLDRDGDVDTADLLELLGSWGECQVGKICWTDFDTNCVTETADLLQLLGHWGACPEGGDSQVPEEILAAWPAGGGNEALLSHAISAEQVGACLDKPTPAEAIAALYELLFD